ncbi:MAG: T9SS type A sorting domain-containing protein, partial [bacterium]|nr:T9SS type A sorting domain-containing protein [bacterium]
EQFRGSFLHLDSINNWIDDDTQLIADAINRNFTKWDDFLGEYIWYEPEPLPETYEEEISYLKNWISNRVNWMDNNIYECGSEVVGITNLEMNNFKIYPNPSNGRFYVESNEKITIEVFDLFGQKILQNEGKSVDLSTVKNGVYIFRIQKGNTSVNRTVIKN